MTQTTLEDQSWNIIQKMAFRFLFIYYAIYMFPFPLYYIPGSDFIFEHYYDLWEIFISWVGEGVLNIDYEFSSQSTGSGDKTYDYVQLFTQSMLALTGGIIWSIIDRKRVQYNRLYNWFIIFIRYYLSFTLLSYGFSKVVISQFPAPWLFRYVETYGNFSPMGLVWNFMGHSAAYTMFSGWAEVIAGTLLLFRRTTILGALTAIGVMTNVVMLNLAYDIPVKLYSSMLLFLGFIILASDWRRLLNLFIFNRESPKADQSLPISNPKWKKVAIILKIILIGYVYYYQIDRRISSLYTTGIYAPKSKLFGLYDVTLFVKNNDTIPANVNDTTRWRNLSIERRSLIGLRMMNDDVLLNGQKIDTTNKVLKIFLRNSKDSLVFNYQAYEADSLLVLNGTRQEDSLYLELHKMNINKFRIKRGFHWINERPYNR